MKNGNVDLLRKKMNLSPIKLFKILLKGRRIYLQKDGDSYLYQSKSGSIRLSSGTGKGKVTSPANGSYFLKGGDYYLAVSLDGINGSRTFGVVCYVGYMDNPSESSHEEIALVTARSVESGYYAIDTEHFYKNAVPVRNQNRELELDLDGYKASSKTSKEIHQGSLIGQ